MSFNTAKYIPLEDKNGPVFTGGIIDNNEPNRIPYQNTPYGRNFRVKGEGIGTRPGFVQRGVNFGSSGYAKGVSVYYRADPAQDRIIVNYPYSGTQKLLSIDPTTYAQTPISTAALIANDVRMNFMSANDSIYCMNGVDLYGKLNGTTYSTPTTGVSNFTPKFGAWYSNSAWCAGDSKFPRRLYKSATNNPDSFSGTGNDVLDAQYPIIGLGVGGQTLYVFTESTIDMINSQTIKQAGSTLYYSSVPLETTGGAVNHNSIVSVGKKVFFLTKSKKIRQVAPNSVYDYDVIDVTHRVNRGITKTMESLDDDQTESFGYVVPDEQVIKWHVKSRGSTYNDLCIVYHYGYDEFMVDTQKTFYGGVWYRNKSFTISQIEPKLYEDEVGDTDDDTPIQFEYRTMIFDFGDPTSTKELWQLRTHIGLNTNTVLTQDIYADGGIIDSRTISKYDIPNYNAGIATKAIGTYGIGQDGNPQNPRYNTVIVREKGQLEVRAKNFQVVYKCSSLGAVILLQRLSPRVQTLDEKVSSTEFQSVQTITYLSTESPETLTTESGIPLTA